MLWLWGIHVGSMFIGCVVYADDILLLPASCHGLQEILNICRSYGETWDIMFNPSKSQIVTFGGQNPCQYQLVLNGNPVPGVNRAEISWRAFLL